ncbi:MAG: thiamine-phosphate kinase [Candidatus Hydrogenedens sp.]|nr:thiamine-phosphate kinase [Candidatus Hydrogenedentota bacterium]NLF56170.1 thiamine-phosphate kinase [Candidatus Hydrogenedens sp.]
MTTLSELGEFGLIARVTAGLKQGGGVVVGTGDDCAVLRLGNGLLLASCDAFIENIHFKREWASPRDIGWKAAASALSDIAAMGGTALYVLATVGSPKDSDALFVQEVCAGIAESVEACGAALVGGDMTGSPGPLILDIAVLGEVSGGRYLARSGALPGDLLAVTGYPGQSAAGLLALIHGIDAPPLIQAHLRPEPRLAEGRWLARQPGAHAMIDLSDGLLQDLGHIAGRSGVGINVDSDLVPMAPALNGFESTISQPLESLTLSGGEDYELAVALDPADAESLCAAFAAEFGHPLTVVGFAEQGWTGIRLDGQEAGQRGFDHFGAI